MDDLGTPEKVLAPLVGGAKAANSNCTQNSIFVIKTSESGRRLGKRA